MSSVSPNNRSCTLAPSVEAPISLTFLLQLHEDDVWALAKSDLRRYFLALQAHIRTESPAGAASKKIVQSETLSLPTCIAVSNFETPIAETQLTEIKSPVAAVTTLRPTPPFLRLPPEVRELIYSYLLSPPGTTRRGPHPRQLQAPLFFSQSFAPAILQTNRQIHGEALAVFYGSKTQRIHITVDYDVWNHKVQRSKFLMSAEATASMRHLHINIYLGNEKKVNRPGKVDSDARLAVAKKGARKLGKWLAGQQIKTLTISWQEPPKTYTWEQKREVLDEFRVLRPDHCEIADLNWGLAYPGKKYQFHVEYLKDLQRDSGRVVSAGNSASRKLY